MEKGQNESKYEPDVCGVGCKVLNERIAMKGELRQIETLQDLDLLETVNLQNDYWSVLFSKLIS